MCDAHYLRIPPDRDAALLSIDFGRAVLDAGWQ